ncbi:N(4)-(Beta-N-acetylglucosaminyl)-L-asparaginase-like [Mytilus californianus]|uniref:N(4)-(Beta-N-acetylglucosaminyl)-L-asparaginase- like n=1 Tax=Mytilus californianus TaxID=6549 RepID=UPI0022466F9E|nr:N(4)-(Beta-N-acetylglucosaminyl)-L-asparaginase-like [Mytilus californianus]
MVPILLLSILVYVCGDKTPIVVTTWSYPNATRAAWIELMQNHGTAVDAVVTGCSACETSQCRGAVGFGSKPDEAGNTTLDAMIMDGKTMDVGAVGCLTNTKSAIAVAKAVMKYTKHTLLVGERASLFAAEMGLGWDNSLSSTKSESQYSEWKQKNCQPNFWENVSPDPSSGCGPYIPANITTSSLMDSIDSDNHDTIAMLAIDKKGDISSGTSTNGLNHKIPGRVGDSPIVGAGSYAMNGVGAAASTGNGDIMMRFLPAFHAVMMMQVGMDPLNALTTAMRPITQFYPMFRGAMIAVNQNGDYAAVCHGMESFDFCVANPANLNVQVLTAKCV